MPKLCYVDDVEAPVTVDEALEQAREGKEFALTPALRATGLRAATVDERLTMKAFKLQRLRNRH